jgi:protein-L-isoaspartate(D-aspartate) O-methyltransferase
LPQYGPYDIIHLGGALPEIPQELYMQLKIGGKMWIPVGEKGSQAIYLVEKVSQGSVKKRKLFNVSYGSLTTVEEQMNF